MKTSVVIPNYNGAELLKKNLPKVLEIGADEIIVVDDASTDGSLGVIEDIKEKKAIKGIKLIKHKKNLGFARSVNEGVVASRGDVVILLNTDVAPQKDLLRYVLPHFKNPEVFAVSFNEGKFGYAKGTFRRGLIEFEGQKPDSSAHKSFWASGGSAAFGKEKWEKLGGLDDMYMPFYWEDVDISYRAQMRGWEIVWEPKARVEHEHEATIGEFLGKKRDWIIERNQFLFFWKNVSSPKLWLLHLLWLPARLFPPGRLIPFFWAILKVPQVLARRVKSGERFVNDEQILSKSGR